MSRFCPDPLESPLEEREERRIEGGSEMAWTGTPKIYDRSPPLIKSKVIALGGKAKAKTFGPKAESYDPSPVVPWCMIDWRQTKNCTTVSLVATFDLNLAAHNSIPRHALLPIISLYVRHLG